MSDKRVSEMTDAEIRQLAGAEPHTSYEQIQDGEFARTVWIRTDLYIDIDADGRILSVARIADQVRQRDIEDVLREAIIPQPEPARPS